MRLLIRPMLSDDVGAVHVINMNCLFRTLKETYTAQQIEAWAQGRTAEGYLEAARNETFVVAETSSIVVGFASWEANELISLFVQPEYQRHGIGTALLAYCAAQAANDGFELTVVKAALGAQTFYERFGFETERTATTVKGGVEIPYAMMVGQRGAPIGAVSH